MRRYSWKPSIPDHRDYQFTLQLASLPTKIDPLTVEGSNPVEDQGQLGSCTGNSSTTALEIVTKSTELSRLMAYYNARKIEGTIKQDAGAMIRDVMKGFQTVGVCHESLWPYNIATFAKKPTKAMLTEAKAIIPKVKSYERVTSLGQFKTALASGLPVVFGFSVPDYFEGQQVATTGWVPYPSQSAKIIGGHAVCAVGYDDDVGGTSGGYIWVRNSWGTSWGINGDFKMPYSWFAQIDTANALVSDCWVIHPV